MRAKTGLVGEAHMILFTVAAAVRPETFMLFGGRTDCFDRGSLGMRGVLGLCDRNEVACLLGD